MSQPEWKFLANLGDADPLENGGLFLYEDTTGLYGFELERVEPCENGKVEIHRVCLDRLKEVRDGNRVYLVPFAYSAGWPHPASQYEEWFVEDLRDVAVAEGTSEADMRRLLCSEDGRERAEAYRAIYDYRGWENGDSYPLTLSVAEARKRYSQAEVVLMYCKEVASALPVDQEDERIVDALVAKRTATLATRPLRRRDGEPR